MSTYTDLLRRLDTRYETQGYYAALCGEAADAIRAMQRQDIASAPRDGTPILLFGRGNICADGFWEPKAWAGNGAWVWPYVTREPTHWMPIPE